jgi:hypothetical protein
MHFQSAKEGWRVTFLEQDLKTSLPRSFVFQSPERVEEMARRGGADWTSADRQAIEHGISQGRGGAWLNLTPEQYAKLHRRS